MIVAICKVLKCASSNMQRLKMCKLQKICYIIYFKHWRKITFTALELVINGNLNTLISIMFRYWCKHAEMNVVQVSLQSKFSMNRSDLKAYTVCYGTPFQAIEIQIFSYSNHLQVTNVARKIGPATDRLEKQNAKRSIRYADHQYFPLCFFFKGLLLWYRVIFNNEIVWLTLY